MRYNYIVSLLLGIDPRIKCKLTAGGVVGADCEIEPWTVSIGGVEITLPFRIPHMSWQTLIDCALGVRSGCGRNAEIYKIRRVAMGLAGDITPASVSRAMYEIYGRAGWSDRRGYACNMAKFLTGKQTLDCVFS